MVSIFASQSDASTERRRRRDACAAAGGRARRTIDATVGRATADVAQHLTIDDDKSRSFMSTRTQTYAYATITVFTKHVRVISRQINTIQLASYGEMQQ